MLKTSFTGYNINHHGYKKLIIIKPQSYLINYYYENILTQKNLDMIQKLQLMRKYSMIMQENMDYNESKKVDINR